MMHSNTLTHIRTESDLDVALAALTSADARFAAIAWPEEYGGRNASFAEQVKEARAT